jgi:uncharacterized protein Usg
MHIRKPDEDFIKSLRGYEYTLIKVYYYVPDYNSIINEFSWQTLDIPPCFPRIHSFLNYWQSNIEAVIKEIELAHGNNRRSLKKVDEFFDLH